MNNLIVLPCTKYQEPLINFLKKENNVIGINPVENETTKCLDFFIKKNIFDIDGILESISMLPKSLIPIKDIFTDQSDVAVLPSIELAEKMNIKHNKKSCVEKFSCDKGEMYKNIVKNGFKCLNFQIVTCAEEINLKYPFIVKPSDSANSRGVIKINSEEELKDGFDCAIAFSRNKKLIAQEWSNSEFQITCEGICINGKHETLSSSYKGPYLETAVTSFVRWPLSDKLSREKIEEIYKINDSIVHSTEIESCLTHSEYILDGDTVYLNEIACRGGGFKISSDITPWVSGIDCYKHLYDYRIKNKINKIEKPLERSAIIQFFTEGNNQIKKHENIIEYQDDLVADQFLKNKKNPRKGYFLAIADDSSSLNEILK